MCQLVAESAAHAAALELVIKPAAIHRAMRALLHVLRVQYAADKPLKVLLIDEDLNAGGEALRQLMKLWDTIHRMAPTEAPPPDLDLHYYSDGESHDRDYDLVIDHAVFLSPDQVGASRSPAPRRAAGSGPSASARRTATATTRVCCTLGLSNTQRRTAGLRTVCATCCGSSSARKSYATGSYRPSPACSAARTPSRCCPPARANRSSISWPACCSTARQSWWTPSTR